MELGINTNIHILQIEYICWQDGYLKIESPGNLCLATISQSYMVPL
jgi:hypothetical protein